MEYDFTLISYPWNWETLFSTQWREPI